MFHCANRCSLYQAIRCRYERPGQGVGVAGDDRDPGPLDWGPWTRSARAQPAPGKPPPGHREPGARSQDSPPTPAPIGAHDATGRRTLGRPRDPVTAPRPEHPTTTPSRHAPVAPGRQAPATPGEWAVHVVGGTSGGSGGPSCTARPADRGEHHRGPAEEVSVDQKGEAVLETGAVLFLVSCHVALLRFLENTLVMSGLGRGPTVGVETWNGVHSGEPPWGRRRPDSWGAGRPCEGAQGQAVYASRP